MSNSCDCQEGAELQKLLINHHLSHAFPKPIDQIQSEEIEFKAEEYVEEEYVDEEFLEVKEELDWNEALAMEYDGIDFTYEEVVSNTTNKIEYLCSYCPMSFSTKKTLNAHYFNEHHPDNTIPCSECNNRFNCEKKLKSHLNKHEADQSFVNGVYLCRICQKECITKARLIAHIQTHFAEFECDLCPKKFTK